MNNNPIDTADDLLTADEIEIKRLMAQFPKPPPPVQDLNNPDPDFEPTYLDIPPGLFPIALLKSKYSSKHDAVVRAVELAKIRGVKIHGFFETAVAYVAQVYKPLPAVEASKEVGF